MPVATWPMGLESQTPVHPPLAEVERVGCSGFGHEGSSCYNGCVVGRCPQRRCLLLAALALCACPGDSGAHRDHGVDTPWTLPPDGLPDGPVVFVELEPQPPNPRKVQVVYIVPSDRVEQAPFVAALDGAARHVQLWLRDQLGQSRTVTLASPSVRALRSTRSSAWFSTNSNAETPELRFAANLRAQAKELAAAQGDDPDTVWLVYVDALSGCGQIGSTVWGHLVVYDSNDLHGIAGRPSSPKCPGASEPTLPPCRWVGGMALWLSFALGVPQCAAPCPADALMGNGFYSYPDARLLDSDKQILTSSPFISPVKLPVQIPSCN